MVAFEVAWDKLAQFQSADEIAEFLEGEGIKADPRNPYSCAISRWMQQTTGNHTITANSNSTGRYLKNPDGSVADFIIAYNTKAMSDFVSKFDAGDYHALVDHSGWSLNW